MLIECKRSLPPAFSWERGHLGRHFCGRDARAPKGEWTLTLGLCWLDL